MPHPRTSWKAASVAIALPRARPGSPCRGSATALARDQVPRAAAVPRPSRATCPVGGLA
ncbi:MAG: hypothetical protein IKH25_01655 [Muribaculaceae bacterium]|nr:hypothetical protein [Muribaculaceae bacterium]